MNCPSCKAVVGVLEGACPTCQDDAQPPATALAPYHHPNSSPHRGGERLGEGFPIVSAPAVVSSSHPSVPWPGSGQSHPMLAALPRLPALLWRQPIVRATVRTGASAVALSLALRMAGRMLANHASPAPSVTTTLPTLADLFAPPGPTAHRHTRRHRRRHATHQEGEAIETLIYIRRVFRDTR